MDIWAEILEERKRQDSAWGVQNHPDFDPVLTKRMGGCSQDRMAEHFEVPTPVRARGITSTAAERGELCWMPILQEEVSELLQWNDPSAKETLKRELIQVAAVAVAWIESIERRGE